MFENILVAVDFSLASKHALHAANRIASKCNSKQFVVHVLSFLANVEQASKHLVPGADWLTAFRNELEAFVQAEPHTNRMLDVLANEDACYEILQFAQHHQCQLIVAGSHGHSALVNTLLGSTTQKLMRESAIPIMIVPSLRHPAKDLKFEGILVPTDFSPVSIKALRLAIRMAESWKSSLHLIHVVDPEEIRRSSKTGAVINAGDFDVSSTLHQMLEENESKADACVSTLFGDPCEEILKYAKEHNLDFIVMGSHGRKGLDRVLIGSTTVSVVRHSQVPIVTLCEQPQEKRNV